MNNNYTTLTTADPNLFSFGQNTTSFCRILTVPVCPDLLDYSALGEADGLRGKIIRAFFFVMRLWPKSANRSL